MPPTRASTKGGSDSRRKKPASAASPVTRYRKQIEVVSRIRVHAVDRARATPTGPRSEPASPMRSVPAATPLR
jgi:hypothetical protein